MSVIAFEASEVKAMQAATVKLCGDHVQGPVWAAMYLANHRAYSLSYLHRDLDAEEMAAHEKQYAEAQAKPGYYDLSTPEGIFKALQALAYNLISNGGTRPLEVVDGMEQARRQVLGSVAFEMMPINGSRHFIHLDGFANIRRVDFNHYEISSHDPNERYDQVYLMDGRPHPFEGLRTTNPREAFQKVWQMHDDCFTHWLIEHEKKLTAWAQKVALKAQAS